ncbi:acyl-CoA thioester hydrolase [Oikeobacillus pervagus]|uniref:Acyl-CoA thioester hydrolase n=1 Tax=Oikeobacillus pervagus TaxID=1325931 RepID=A0AAJ1WJG0_9BACI|nr:thioesterase family protein [Oikeobacillus pervagus]MDQ0215428.1 acyl-CoA thioester hydrolase [Oikeobacillus pervagus]
MKKIAYIEDWNAWNENFHFFQKIKVRFSETDMFGHLNNTVPFAYFEEARIEFFDHVGLMQEWSKEESEEIIVVADLQCDFLQQVYFGETLKVYVKPHQVGNSSVDLHYKVLNEKEEICLTGRGTIVQISKKTGRSMPLSNEWKKKLQNLTEFSPSC